MIKVALLAALAASASAFSPSSSFLPSHGLRTRAAASSTGIRMSLEKYKEELRQTAAKIAAPGKGILAVDESTKTIGKRLQSIGCENTEANRQAYRGLLFTTPGLGEYISGAILYEETLFQNHADGTPFVKCLDKLGVIPGIKVDTGLEALPGADPIETWCTGLDGLLGRAQSYYKQGARFAKWRTVLQISANTPTALCQKEAAWGLARYARTCQEAGLVPIVEPEILMDGDHDLETTAKVQEKVLAEVYKYLSENGVYLEGSLLKPSMTVPGADCKKNYKAEEIAKATIQTLERTVPSAVPGITFLSGGMSEEEASVNLSVMNAIPRKGPWSLTFSYGRALQQSCLKTWLGKPENVKAAQEALLARARANGLANLGKYKAGMEKSLDRAGTFEAGYKY